MKQKLVLIGNGMAGIRTLEELLKLQHNWINYYTMPVHTEPGLIKIPQNRAVLKQQ